MDRRSGNGGQFISLVLLGSDGSGGESHDSSAVRGKILGNFGTHPIFGFLVF